MKTGILGAALVLVALSFAAGCELAFPFDRYLIPEEAGAVAEVDSGSFAEDASLPIEDSAVAADVGTDASGASPDGSTNQDATTDGSQDATSAADAVTDSEVAPDEGADGSDGSDG